MNEQCADRMAGRISCESVLFERAVAGEGWPCSSYACRGGRSGPSGMNPAAKVVAAMLTFSDAVMAGTARQAGGRQAAMHKAEQVLQEACGAPSLCAGAAAGVVCAFAVVTPAACSWQATAGAAHAMAMRAAPACSGSAVSNISISQVVKSRIMPAQYTMRRFCSGGLLLCQALRHCR